MNINNCIIVKDKEEYKKSLKKYLVSLPVFKGDNKTFNHQTIIVSGLNKDDARSNALRLSNASYTGKIKEIK